MDRNALCRLPRPCGAMTEDQIMAKSGFGKFLAVCTVAAAAAAGVYYYLNKKDSDFIDDFDDDFDDFDDFDEDSSADSRNYVDLERDDTLDREEDEADTEDEKPADDDTFHVGSGSDS